MFRKRFNCIYGALTTVLLVACTTASLTSSAGAFSPRANASADDNRAATSATAVVARPGGGFEIFYRAYNGAVLARTMSAGRWSAPVSLGGVAVGAPAAAVVAGNLVVACRGTTGSIYVKTRSPGSGWTSWENLGGTNTSAPAVTGWSDGRIDIFARDADDRIQTRTKLTGSSSWTPWLQLPGSPVDTGPAGVATGSGRIDLLATGPDHRVLHRSLSDGVWSDWSGLGGTVSTYVAPAVSRIPSTGRLLVFVRAADNQLVMNQLISSGWNGWVSEGGQLIDTPGAATSATGFTRVITRGVDNALYGRYYSGGAWSTFVRAWAPTPPPPLGVNLRGTDWQRIPTTSKVVALTFDAGANADGFASIRATLQHNNVPATFFLTGSWARYYPGKANEIAMSGFLIGNHSNTHPHFTQLTDAQVSKEVRDAQTTILQTSGVDTRPLFRFPFGDVNARVIGDVNNLGYAPVRWTVDSLGWQGTSGGQTTQRVIDRVVSAAQPGEIVLMHTGSNPDDGTTLDAAALPTIIERLRSLGYRFVTLQTLTG